MSGDVVIRYWGGAKAAAGLESETVHADSVAAALTTVRERRRDNAAFQRALTVSSVLVDGIALSRDRLDRPIDGAVTAEVLPPFAGGARGRRSAPD